MHYRRVAFRGNYGYDAIDADEKKRGPLTNITPLRFAEGVAHESGHVYGLGPGQVQLQPCPRNTPVNSAPGPPSTPGLLGAPAPGLQRHAPLSRPVLRLGACRSLTAPGRA